MLTFLLKGKKYHEQRYWHPYEEEEMALTKMLSLPARRKKSTSKDADIPTQGKNDISKDPDNPNLWERKGLRKDADIHTPWERTDFSKGADQ